MAVGCVNHDLQNVLTWSLATLSSNGLVVRSLFISIPACRNGFNHLHNKVKGWVEQNLLLSSVPFRRQQVEAFWVLLGVDPEISMRQERGVGTHCQGQVQAAGTVP